MTAGFLFLALLAVIPAGAYVARNKLQKIKNKKAAEAFAGVYDLDNGDKDRGDVASQSSIGFVESGDEFGSGALHKSSFNACKALEDTAEDNTDTSTHRLSDDSVDGHDNASVSTDDVSNDSIFFRHHFATPGI
jgi:hypothetical protein